MRPEKRLNFIGVKLNDSERAELDDLKTRLRVSDSSVVRAALKLLAEVACSNSLPEGKEFS